MPTKVPTPAPAERDAATKRPADVTDAMGVLVEHMRTLTLVARAELLKEMEKDASSGDAEGKEENPFAKRMDDIPPLSTDEVARKATETVLGVLAQRSLKNTKKREAVGDWVNAVYMTPFKEDVLRFCAVAPVEKKPSYVDYSGEATGKLVGLSKKVGALCSALSGLQVEFVETKRNDALAEPCWARGEEPMTYCAMLVCGDGDAESVSFYVGETKAKKTSQGRWSLSSGHVAGVRNYLAAGLPQKSEHPPNDALYKALATSRCRYVFVYVLGDGTDEDRWEACLLRDLNERAALSADDRFAAEPLHTSEHGLNVKAGTDRDAS